MSGERSLLTHLNQAGLLLCWVVIGLLARHAFWGDTGIFSLKHVENRVTEIQETNQRIINENEMLQDEVAYRRSELYLEELLRTELGYARSGERIVRWIPGTGRVDQDDDRANQDRDETPGVTVSPAATTPTPD